MFSRNPFQLRSSTCARAFALCALLVVVALAMTKAIAPRSHAAGKRQQLTFEDRVAAQRAIEEVYHRHRIWPADNPEPKPPLDQALPEAALRAKVEDYLRMSSALEVYWQRPVTAADLQAEVERMARDTRQPEVLGELWAALGNDPMLIAECLARPLLVERLAREEYEKAEGGKTKDEAKADSLPPSSRSLPPFDEWWSGVRAQMEMAEAAGGEYRLPEIAAVAAPCGGELWIATNTTGAPSVRSDHSAVWTGSEMIVWGGNTTGNANFPLNTGGRYNPATDTWSTTNTTGAPSARYGHSAVWTGSEMIFWGGFVSGFGIANTGGRYNPAADSWTANITTTGAPNARSFHSAVWTGSEMLIWGGLDNSSRFNTGGRFNPVANSWTANIATIGASSARAGHSAVWTGSEMIIWGGFDSAVSDTGRRYNPAIDAWTATITTTNAPSARVNHSAVWTGSEMIIWGGETRNANLNTGKSYSPATDTWTTNITTTSAPSARHDHSAIWTGSEMIVWGGLVDGFQVFNTGGRYSSAPPLSLSSNTQSFSPTGGTGNIAVNAPGGCTWTATSNTNWLTITSGSSGAGNGTVAFTVAANALGPRTGLLTISNQTFTVRQAGVATPRLLRVMATGAAPGSSAVPVALELVSQGDENALGFTLSFDPAVLSNPQAALGADAAGAQFGTNTNQIAQGRIGIGLALPAGQKFAAGTRQIAVVTFSIAANAQAGPIQMTPLDFDDLPSAREVSDVSANGLPAAYQGGSMSVVPGSEGDVAPRPQGNGAVTITDWVQIGRFAAGLDALAAGVEFQRADCAPRDTKGNGALSVADWTQAGRYAIGTDAIAAAGGPVVAAASAQLAAGGGRQAAGNSRWPRTPDDRERTIRLSRDGGDGFVVAIEARVGENAFGFSLSFNPAEWRFVSAGVGRDAGGAALHVNSRFTSQGRVGFALALPVGQALPAGARQIVLAHFQALPGRGHKAVEMIEFGDLPVRREVVDAEANALPVSYVRPARKW